MGGNQAVGGNQQVAVGGNQAARKDTQVVVDSQGKTFSLSLRTGRAGSS